jgi:formiminotetrahydrofolate cyclodeaminase
MTAVRQQTVEDYVAAIASTSAVPGGGSAAALAAAMGSALLSMVAKLSAKKAKEEADRATLNDLVPKIDALTTRLLELSQQDIEAYRSVIDIRKSGAGDLDAAYQRAADVPLETASTAAQALALGKEVSQRAWGMTASDLTVGSDLLQAGLRGALGNVEINLPEIKGEAAARIERRYQELLAIRGR